MKGGGEKLLDLRGKKCPYTLLDLERELSDISSFKRVVVISDYEPAVNDTIPAFCEKRSLRWRKERTGEGAWRIIIER